MVVCYTRGGRGVGYLVQHVGNPEQALPLQVLVGGEELGMVSGVQAHSVSQPYGCADDDARRAGVAAVLEQHDDAEQDLQAQQVLVSGHQVRHDGLGVLEEEVCAVVPIRPPAAVEQLGNRRAQGNGQHDLDGSPGGLVARRRVRVPLVEHGHEGFLVEQRHDVRIRVKVVVDNGHDVGLGWERQLVPGREVHGQGELGRRRIEYHGVAGRECDVKVCVGQRHGTVAALLALG